LLLTDIDYQRDAADVSFFLPRERVHSMSNLQAIKLASPL